MKTNYDRPTVLFHNNTQLNLFYAASTFRLFGTRPAFETGAAPQALLFDFVFAFVQCESESIHDFFIDVQCVHVMATINANCPFMLLAKVKAGVLG